MDPVLFVLAAIAGLLVGYKWGRREGEIDPGPWYTGYQSGYQHGLRDGMNHAGDTWEAAVRRGQQERAA